ncbi:hypothetical protein D3C81_1554970 [compost metagenome]
MAHDHGVDHVEFFVGELVLAQLAQAGIGIEHHLAAGGFQIAAEDLHERRLAATVGADQAVAVAVAELDGNVLEQRLGAELHGDVSGGNHESDLQGEGAGAQKTYIVAFCVSRGSLKDRRLLNPDNRDGRHALLDAE